MYRKRKLSAFWTKHISWKKETIEEFRFLLNYRFDSMSPMALILAGQTELWDKLRLQRYAAVRQRIDINCVLPHLTGQKPKNISYHIWSMPGEGRISSQTGHWTISIKNLPGSAAYQPHLRKKPDVCQPAGKTPDR